jgi:hypothetical protein
VRFAVTRAGVPARPLMATMADKTCTGRDLYGMDATAQAGMILGMVRTLGQLQLALLIAGTAQRTVPCYCKRACCSGHMANSAWREALLEISEFAYNKKVVRADSGLRIALLVKIYGGGIVTYKRIAEELKWDVDAVSRHHHAMHLWLMGKRGMTRAEGTEGVDPSAWAAAETLLRDAGIVG